MTDDLLTWLRAQLDDDERAARTAAALQADPENGWGTDGPTAVTPHIGVIHEDEARQHVVRHDPARVLAEVDAKRRIIRTLELHTRHLFGSQMVKPEAAQQLLQMLALPYADRPGYRDEWAPA